MTLPPQETCADCGYMRSLTAPCKCGKYLKLSPGDLLNEMKAASYRWYGVCRLWHALTGPAREQHRDVLYRTVKAMNTEIEAIEREEAQSSNAPAHRPEREQPKT